MGQATQLLQSWNRGDREARDRLLLLLYEELRQLARRAMLGERAGHTLSPTALLHEAYSRLIDIDQIEWQGRQHFVALAVQAMRRVLIDYARGKQASKRDGGMPVTLRDGMLAQSAVDVPLLDLDRALSELRQLDPDRATVAELRLIGGLTIDEVAAVTATSAATVSRRWRVARAWLVDRLSESPA